MRVHVYQKKIVATDRLSSSMRMIDSNKNFSCLGKFNLFIWVWKILMGSELKNYGMYVKFYVVESGNTKEID